MGKRTGFRSGAWLGLGLAFAIAAATPSKGQTDEPTGTSDEPAARADEASARSREPVQSGKAGGLRMSRAVVCRSIDGYEAYVPLPDAAQTSDEKLLVYYRPLRYKVDFVEGSYQARFTQDAEIRKRGEKKSMRQKLKLFDYTAKSKDPPRQIYIRNTISLKGLEPGDYDLTIILHDELDKAAPASRQVVRFKVIPPHDPRTKKAAEQVEDPPSE
jgi:hypothetical protein